MKDKDPAFLFYSKDFYEGTRTMLPKERACLVDLMIYQHQHGAVPNDPERMCMYCSGVDEATLQATLKAKFKLTDEGWVNGKMAKTSNDREAFAQKQSENGLLGQFLKKAKAATSLENFEILKRYVFNVLGKDETVKLLKVDKATHEGVLEGLLKHLAIENASAIEDVIEDDINKGVPPKIPPLPPSFTAFIPPEVEDVINCFASTMTALGLPHDAYGGAEKLGTAFVAYYSTQGWRKGNGLTMTAWRPLIPSWIADEKGNASKSRPPTQQPTERPERSWNKKQ